MNKILSDQKQSIKLKVNARKQKGAVLIFSAGMMVVLLIFCAFAINVYYLYLVRNELQNAADAAALAGAAYLYPLDASGNPQWSLGQTKATAAVSMNKAAESTLLNSTVQGGLWDFSQIIVGLQAIGTPTTSAAAAIKVKISKSVGLNGGPLNLFFGSILGVTSANVSAEAIAAVGFPSKVAVGTLFPLVIPKSSYTAYWDSVTGKPKINPATGQPYVFTIDSTGTNGQWSSFTIQANDANTIRGLFTTGNPTALGVGDLIWVANGVKNTLFASVTFNVNVVVIVIENTGIKGGYTPIVAFGVIHIDGSVDGKSLQVHFINDYKIPSSGISGANYGVRSPPKLVK